MTTSGHKRLDGLEVNLTPKEFAIRLAREMREHPSQGDFWKSVAKREYRNWPWVLPFQKLDQQAKARYSGKRPEGIDQCMQHAWKLRTEFHTLTRLIRRANEIIENKAEEVTRKTSLKVSMLQNLILKEAFSRTAKKATCIERKTALDAENQLILEELRSYDDPTLSSLIEPLANDLVLLMRDILKHQISVELVQDRYFDGHPILSGT
jgi:hypothetical protein